MSWFRSSKNAKGTQQETQAGINDTLNTTQQGPRDPEHLDALWTQTKLPQKYRAHISDEHLDAMASKAEQDGTPLRSVITDHFREEKEKKDAKEFDEAPEYRHTFYTATHRKGFRFNPWKHLAGVFFMTISPWLLFLGIGVMFIYMYYSMPLITLFIVFIIGALSCLFLLSGALSGSLFRTFFGVLFLLATMTSCLAGVSNYHERLFHYWSATEGRQYTNVRSDSLAAAHADAGVLVFTDEAMVDVTKTTGFKSGTTYCVAPITRKDQKTERSTIQYWAAGVDCCHGRGDFSCDDANDKAAKSGLVIRALPASMLFKSELDYYMHALEMSREIYGLESAKEPFFVRWTTDTAAKAESFLINGWVAWVYYGLAFLVFNFVLAVLFQGVLFQQQDNSGSKKDNSATGEGEEEPMLVTRGPGAYRQGKDRWAGLENETMDDIPPQADPMKTMENDMRGIDTSTMPGQNVSTRYGQPSPYDHSVATPYDRQSQY